jgi:DNA end-binding protein Ku
MAPRPSWKGLLKLSLVSCGVSLFPATTTSQRVHFHIINRETGNRIHNDVVDAETGELVAPEDRVKGYEIAKGHYVLIDNDEFDQVALESTHTIEINQFVPMADVDRIYLDESYYIVPQDEVSREAFAVIREAMHKEDLAGLARVVVYRRERLLLLRPRGKGLLATTLRYHNEVRNEDDYFDDIPATKVPTDMLKLATHILDTKKGEFDPSKFEDRYENALLDLIKAKSAGKPPPPAPETKPSNVVNLMDALRRSAQTERRRPAGTRKKATRAKKTASRRKAS